MNKEILLKNKNILRIGLGTSGFGGYFGSNSINQDYKKKFINFFNKAYDYGIRFVDTAESYASGESEKLLGYLPNHQKDNLFIASKFNFFDSKLSTIESSLDKTLLRLNRDYVDLYMPHWPFPEMNIEELMESLKKLKDKGKLKYIGLSNFENYLKNFKNFPEIKFYESELNPYYTNAYKILSQHLDKSQSFLVGYAPFKQGIVFNKMSKIYNFFRKNYDNFPVTLAQFILIWMLLLSNRNIVIPKTENIKRLSEFVDIFKLDHKIISAIKKKIISLQFDKELKISTKEIIMKKDGDRPIYFSLQDALKNEYSLHPNVLDIANEIKKNKGNLLKPIRLIQDEKSKKYFCVDGRLKYWAWVYLYGKDSQIQSVIY